MNKPKFSPGPWEIEHVIDDEGDHIWWVNTQFGEPAAAKCFDPYNAQLISVVPIMYEVVEMIEKILEEDKFRLEEYGFNLGGDRALALELAKKALAKARGMEVSEDA